jgi:hypothetical protein
MSMQPAKLLFLLLLFAARIDAHGFPAGSTERYPGAPRGKVWKPRLFRLLAPLVRGQL